ncbi:MAG: hypothetical protein L3K02_04035 [Thermoplasmata archaeon]|nr:hypothetical protein [Thermoplasmata archaeon]
MALVPLASVDSSALRWLRTGEEPAEFTLFAGDDAIAIVRWPKGGGFRATAETSDGRWTFQRAGFLHSHLTLRGDGAPADAARITLHVGVFKEERYHRIEFATGAAYRFHRAGVQVPAWQITTDDSTELVHVEPVREGSRLVGAAVILTPAGSASRDLAALLVFSWYFVGMVWFEDEALLPLERVLSDLETR